MVKFAFYFLLKLRHHLTCTWQSMRQKRKNPRKIVAHCEIVAQKLLLTAQSIITTLAYLKYRRFSLKPLSKFCKSHSAFVLYRTTEIFTCNQAYSDIVVVYFVFLSNGFPG